MLQIQHPSNLTMGKVDDRTRIQNVRLSNETRILQQKLGHAETRKLNSQNTRLSTDYYQFGSMPIENCLER